MALFRLVYAEPCRVCKMGAGCLCATPRPRIQGPIVTRKVHGVKGPSTCPRAEGKGKRCTPSTCPAVLAEVMELWVSARTIHQALVLGHARYPQPPMRILRGLHDRTRSYLGSRKANLVGGGHKAQSRSRAPALAGSDRVELASG